MLLCDWRIQINGAFSLVDSLLLLLYRDKFKRLMIFVCIAIIPISLIAPWTNSIAQMFVGIGTCALLLAETKRYYPTPTFLSYNF